MEFRKGDLVRYRTYQNCRNSREGKLIEGLVVGTGEGKDKVWYCIRGHISVNPIGGGTGSICRPKELKLIKKREELKYWWRYL